jgi:uracil-DNA glycosylase
VHHADQTYAPHSGTCTALVHRVPVARRFQGAQRFLPVHRSLRSLHEAAASCHGCPLYKDATQVVFGEGPTDARALFVGEVPGDHEDRAGHPFVGPAGRLLDEALAAAGIAREHVFVTNAVKHFKFTRRGKRRIHDKPSRYEVVACRPWLDAELALVEPEVVVVLGATAGQALFGPSFRIEPSRGHDLHGPFAPHTFATLHPAAVLRAPDHALREIVKQRFFDDVALVGECLRAGGA